MISSERPSQSLRRREFLTRAGVFVGMAAAGSLSATVWARRAGAASMPAGHVHGALRAALTDEAAVVQDAQQAAGNAGVVEMEGEFYKPVRLPPKPDAKPLLEKKQIESLERTLACPCPCTLDIFTCRTTMLSCGFSPRVHSDITAMVNGGYSADEIMAAMRGTYGNNILMAPPKEGINLIAWFAPFAALGTGAILLNAMLHKWRRNSEAAAIRSSEAMIKPADVVATDDEMARLRRALRDDK